MALEEKLNSELIVNTLGEFTGALENMMENIMSISDAMTSMDDIFRSMKEEAGIGEDYAKESHEEAYSIMNRLEQEGCQGELLELSRKYQANSKIMFDKMQDFAYLANSFSEQVSEVTNAVNALQESAQMSINAVNLVEEGVRALCDKVKEA